MAALGDADEETSVELLDKLKELVTNQRDIIGTIIAENVANEEIQQTIIAVRDELDEILPIDIRKPVEETIMVEQNIFHGFIVTAYGQFALNAQGTLYLLQGTNVDLSQYVGVEQVRVVGDVIENPTPLMKYGLQVQEITILSALIFENQDYIVNDLPRVEDSQK